MRLLSIACLLAATIPTMAATSVGGNYSLTGQISGGGGISTGGSTQLLGVAGLPANGRAVGGEIALFSGAIAFFTLPFGDYELQIRIDSSNQVTLTWPTEAAAYRLEYSPAVGASANWNPVSPAPSGSRFTIVPDQTRFYRLHRP